MWVRVRAATNKSVLETLIYTFTHIYLVSVHWREEAREHLFLQKW